jgi:hypothetical protein
VTEFGGNGKGFRMASVVEAAGLIDGWFGVSMTVDDVHGGFDAELIGEFATQFGFTNNFAGVCGIVADGGGMYGARDRGKGLLVSGWDCESDDFGAGCVASAFGDPDGALPADPRPFNHRSFYIRRRRYSISSQTPILIPCSPTAAHRCLRFTYKPKTEAISIEVAFFILSCS